MLQQLGPDTGFDSIGDFDQAKSLASFFNELDKTDQLAKTVIYNLNPRDNEVFASMIGNFNDGSIKGKCNMALAGGTSIRKMGWKNSSMRSRILVY